MPAPLIDIEFLREIHHNNKEAPIFRLPEDPALPTHLRGKTLNTEGLITLFDKALGLLKAAENDFFAAENDYTMAENKLLPAAERFKHRRKAITLRQQGDIRQVESYALFIGISDAQFLGFANNAS